MSHSQSMIIIICMLASEVLPFPVSQNTHFTHDLSPVEHYFVPLAEAIFGCLLSFYICEISKHDKL